MNLKNICKICIGWLEDHRDLIEFYKCRCCGYTKLKEEYMISLRELNPKGFKLTEEQEKNTVILHEKINKIRALYGKIMLVTSGVRDIEDHKRIYRQKGITDEAKIPMKSKHLFGQAVDIADPKGELAKWCHDNVKHLEDIGLWCEDTEVTKGWVHFQILPPKSGNRFFKP